MNGWIFQVISEPDAGLLALNSFRFPFRFDWSPVYRRSPEIPPSKHNSIEEIVKPMLEEALAADTSLLSRKIHVEPPSSIDDCSMILIEIGVDVDEGHRLT